MPTTADGETVYADPDVLVDYVQTDPKQFSLSTTNDADSDGTNDWQEFLETIQARMKARIDEYCGRDFEDHAGDTRTFSGGPSGLRHLPLPEPVRSVTEVRIDGDVVSSDTYVLDGTQLIRVDADDSALDAEWPAGYGNIAVDLDWGYQSPPADVVEAELKLVSHTMVGLAQKREGMIVQADDNELAVQLPEAMTREIKQMLRQHRDDGGRSAVML